jgi:hypothetical protein
MPHSGMAKQVHAPIFTGMVPVNLRPSDEFELAKGGGGVLLIACGALAREIVELIETNRWTAFDVTCLPAKWHNTPQFIPEGVREKIRANKGRYRNIFVLYGDCGTGGLLDKVLEEEGVERIDGPTATPSIPAMPPLPSTPRRSHGVLSHRLSRQTLRQAGVAGPRDGRPPELLPLYFGNYTKVIYLAQTRDPRLQMKARAAAARLGLEYEYRETGYGELESEMRRRA